MRDRMRVVDAPDLAALPAIVQRGVISLVIVGASPADEALVLASVGEIRAIDRRVPLILMADTESESLAVAALRSGMTDYLRRPVSVDTIAACVRRCLAAACRPGRA